MVEPKAEYGRKSSRTYQTGQGYFVTDIVRQVTVSRGFSYHTNNLSFVMFTLITSIFSVIGNRYGVSIICAFHVRGLC
jgi:hypothetical protein